jgi:ABC-type glutathione transport system ATPase component
VVKSFKGSNITKPAAKPIARVGADCAPGSMPRSTAQTIRQIITTPLLVHNKVKDRNHAERRATELLETLIYACQRFSRQHPHQLSGGQRQRVSVACSLTVEPQFIVADERSRWLMSRFGQSAKHVIAAQKRVQRHFSLYHA